jgi:hypothetical protein
VDAIEVDAATALAWQQRHGTLAERSRITLFRLGRLVAPDPPHGQARIAAPSDREMLLRWYKRMVLKEDPSEAEYVVDDPIGFGGITLWEVGGEPVAMAGRSRLVAGMVRVGAVYAADHDDAHASAAFVAACRTASDIAEHVLVFAPSADTETAGRYGALGFQPILERVMLGTGDPTIQNGSLRKLAQ